MKNLSKYIVISGIDGSGKTTVIDCLKQRIEDCGAKPHCVWLRYNHIFIKPVHVFCRLVGLSRRHDSLLGKVWRHEFYRSQLFCSFYIFLTYLDSWLGRLKISWQLRRIDADIVICDRWVNDILVDLAVDSRRVYFWKSNWKKSFQQIVPEGAKSFLIVRDTAAVLSCRPECQDDPDFKFRQDMYRRIQRTPGNIIVLSNNGSVEETVDNLVAHMGYIGKRSI